MAITRFETADVQLIDDRSVQVRRTFDAKKDLVYRAYTEPELLKKWLAGYPGWEMSVCEMDTQVGGRYQWKWRNNSENQEFGFFGEFKKVIADKEIQHTQIYDPGTVGGDMGAESLISVTFTESDGSTLVTTTIMFQSKEDRDAAMSTGMTDGMEVNYQLLEKIV